MRAVVAIAVAIVVLAGCSSATGVTARVGECVDFDLSQEQVQSLEGFDCAQEHDAEVFYVGEVAGDDYDATRVQDELITACLDAFSTYIGESYYDSSLDVYYTFPDGDGWDQGDRDTLCAAFEPDPVTGEPLPLTGSLAGSGA